LQMENMLNLEKVYLNNNQFCGSLPDIKIDLSVPYTRYVCSYNQFLNSKFLKI